MASSRYGRKITPALESFLATDQNEGLLDVIIELEPDEAAPSVPTLQEAFHRAAEPVSKAVARLGGEVTDQAWLNRTLRARIPVSGVRELSDLNAVMAVDVPHRITLD